MSGRRIRPTILLAYGEEGLRWLRIMVSELRRGGGGRWFDSGVWQAWAVGCVSQAEGILCVDAVDETVVRAQLQLARPAGFAVQEPSFDPRTVCVVERISALGPAAELHGFTRQVIDAAAKGEIGGATSREFDLQWISLVDSVRSGFADGPATARAARGFFEQPLPKRTFLVDRLADNNGDVTPEVADWVLLELALMALTSDIAMPRLLAGDEGRVNRFEEHGNPGHVTPIAVTAFRHRDDAMHHLLSAEIRSRLARGTDAASREMLRDDFPGVPPLLELIKRDMAGVRPFSTTRERQASLKRFFALHLAGRSTDLALEEIEVARRELKVANASRLMQGGAPLLVSGNADSDLTVPVALGVGALVLIAVWLFHRFRKRKSAEPSSEQFDTADQDEIIRAWSALLNKAEAFTNALVVALDTKSAAGDPAPWRVGATSFEWEFKRATQVSAENASREQVAAVADSLAAAAVNQRIGSDEEAAKRAVGDAIDAAAERTFAQALASLRSRALSALQPEFPARLAQVPLLTHTGLMNPRSEVFWVTANPEKDEELLRSLENGPSRGDCRMLLGDRTDSTWRLLLGVDVQWDTLTSIKTILHT